MRLSPTPPRPSPSLAPPLQSAPRHQWTRPTHGPAPRPACSIPARLEGPTPPLCGPLSCPAPHTDGPSRGPAPRGPAPLNGPAPRPRSSCTRSSRLGVAILLLERLPGYRRFPHSAAEAAAGPGLGSGPGRRAGAGEGGGAAGGPALRGTGAGAGGSAGTRPRAAVSSVRFVGVRGPGPAAAGGSPASRAD